MHKLQKGIAHLSLVVVVIAIGIAGLLFYSLQKGMIKNHPTNYPTPTPSQTFQKREFRLSRIGNIIDEIPEFTLPPGLEAPQLLDAQIIDSTYFVKFLKSNMNFPIYSSIQRSGMLYAKEGDTNWKIFYEITDLAEQDHSSYKNNPYDFWREGDLYYSVIVDTNGAGSGEGNGKLITIDKQSKQWNIIDCFYYVPESYSQYTSSLPDSTPLSQAIQAYNGFSDPELNGDYEFNKTLNKFVIRGSLEEGCTLFELETLPE
jgi:hypothetical protein